MESAIKYVEAINGIDTRIVAYVSHVLAALVHEQLHLNKFIQVVWVYDEVKITFKQNKLYCNLGTASCTHYCTTNTEENLCIVEK